VKSRYVRSQTAVFTFQCTRCRKKPAIITRGRRVFLCADCATGSLWYDMVGSLMDADARAVGLPPDVDGDHQDARRWTEGPIDPWQVSS